MSYEDRKKDVDCILDESIRKKELNAITREIKELIHAIHYHYLNYDSRVKIEIKNVDYLKEYIKNLERCGPHVRLKDGGKLPLDECITIFDKLADDMFAQMDQYWRQFRMSKH
eukprot:UN25180